jgi:5'-nucleotidase
MTNRKTSTQNVKRKSAIPLIVVVNDDGIKSPGIRAMVRSLMDLGEVLVVAPRDQQTSTGRSFRGGGVAEPVHYEIDGKHVRAFAVAATPALAVRYAVLLHAERVPDLIVSGINYGENIGSGLTISGTIGAALEAASMGIPAMAVSLAVDASLHFTHDESVDFLIAGEWGKQFAKRILAKGMPRGADVVNVNVPRDATLKTPWRWTHTSRLNYYCSIVKETKRGKIIDGYEMCLDNLVSERGSDVRAVLVDRVVSVSLLALGLSANVSAREKARWGK